MGGCTSKAKKTENIPKNNVSASQKTVNVTSM
jgi:hypothetical protein